jgi:hypothetical protein
MAAALKRAGFQVILKKNARLQEMEDAIENFGNRLKRGGVGLFYFAGHGVQVSGANYLMPIGTKINRESDVKYQSVDANKVLDEMANANNGLNIVMLDACRDNPFARSFRNASRGLAIVSSAPSGTFISYSTSPGNVARDGEGRNSPYTSALIQYMKKPGLTIEDVFKGVRQKLRKETGQVPWELSSLEGKFYFTAPSAATRESSEPDEAERPASANPMRETTDVAMGARPSVSTSKEIRRDGRFLAYADGTVLDTKTNLMWAAKDNESDINWADAKSYCENYRGGGYTNWRMPKQEELADLYEGYKKYKPILRSYYVHLTELIQLSTCCPWASETRDSEAAYFRFDNDDRKWVRQSYSGFRALPVRSGKTVTVAEVSSASETAENFGMTVQDITTEVAKYLGIASNIGVIIVDVKHGSNADKTGIQPRDIIMQVYKVKISSLKEYLREISKKSAENSVLLLMKRGKATFYVRLDR